MDTIGNACCDALQDSKPGVGFEQQADQIFCHINGGDSEAMDLEQTTDKPFLPINFVYNDLLH